MGPVRIAAVRGGCALAFAVVSLAAPVRAEAVPEVAGVRAVPIEDPSGKALSAFFASLDRTRARKGRAVTRVAHYGDSLIVGDLITRTLRRLYQERYGDGGPGFILAGRPWPWYRRQGIRHGATDGWITQRVLKGALRDRMYGYGGVSFATRRRDRRVWYTTTEDNGRPIRISRIDVHYLAQPGGGDLDVLVDDEHIITLGTDGATRGSAFHELRVRDAPHKVVLRTAGGGEVRLFGVALERAGPGVVYDSLGINGACATSLGRMNQEHLTRQFAHREPSLIVTMFGANESNRPALVRAYRQSLLPVLQRLREAAPEASCLVMSPMDRGQRRDDRPVRTNPRIPRIVEAQRDVAFEAGCAFYDTYTAMGGNLSIYRWSRRGLASGDLTHPTPEGGAIVGGGLFTALEEAYAASRR